MLEVDKVLQLKEEFILYKLELDKGMFWLFNIENGDSFKLNEISYYILSLLDGKRSVKEIYKCVLNRYQETDPSTISKDLKKLLQKMKTGSIFEERRIDEKRE